MTQINLLYNLIDLWKNMLFIILLSCEDNNIMWYKSYYRKQLNNDIFIIPSLKNDCYIKERI